MSLFLACLGGSGSKVVEAVTHMAAMGAWDDDDIHVLLVDVDGGNGNVDRAIRTVTNYQGVNSMKPDFQLFRSRLTLYRWTPVPQNVNLAMMAAGGDSELVSRYLFSPDELDMNVDSGFKGHPNIGVLYMQNILNQQANGDNNGLSQFISAVQTCYTLTAQAGDDRGNQQAGKPAQAVRVMLVGSCYGGTGASCIPTLGRYLRKRLNEQIGMGLLALLPTFSLQKNTTDATDPDSREFPDRVKTVLSTYISEDILQYRPDKQSIVKPLFEQIYLLGSPDLIPFRQYSPGKSQQENPATFFDWFACTAIQEYNRQEDPLNQGIYTAWLSPGPWDWEQLAQDCFPGLQMKAARLMIGIGLYMSELHVQVRDILVDRKNNELETYFSNVPVEEQAQLSADFDCFAQYGAMLTLWFYQIVTNLPEIFKSMVYESRRERIQSEQLQKKLKDLHMDLSAEDRQDLYMLYYQRFFCAPALFRMEQTRRRYWPRGNEHGDDFKRSNQDLVDAFLQIYKNRWGREEERALGVLLPLIVKNNYYPGAWANQLMGLIYCDSRFCGQTKDAVPTLLRRLFLAIDSFRKE